MIQVSTTLKIIDNSGGKYSKIIRILGGNKKKKANLGNLTVVSIKKVKNKESKVKRGEVHKLRLLRLRDAFLRKDGTSLRFDEGGGIILKDSESPLASRINGPLYRELKKKYGKITSLSKKLI
jgi:large subunit ribosomal protein L14